MQRCFQLAKKGLGSTAPNPLVGAVIVYDKRIIGEGWHKKYGEAHAEVNAVAAVKEEDRKFLKNSTLYVNLEPCNHHGKTPPCVDLVLKHQFKKVVICNVDSNPLVGGKGIARLRENDVEVTTGVLEKEGRWLNRRFFTSIEKNRPFIILKWAQSKDGFLSKNDGKQTWITNEKSRILVHKWRSEEAGILIGKNTLLSDNPRLNNRYFSPKKQPTRIVISKEIPNDCSLHFFDDTQPTIIVNKDVEAKKNMLQYWQFNFNSMLLFNFLERLNKQNIQSIIIEGGKHTLQAFIDQNLWDEARILTGNSILKTGLKAPHFSGIEIEKYNLDQDQISIQINQ